MTSVSFNLTSFTPWLSIRGKTSCKLHKMFFRRFVGTSTSRGFKIQNGCHVNKGKIGKMRFYSPFIHYYTLSLHFTPGHSLQSAFYSRSAVCSLCFTLTDLPTSECKLAHNNLASCTRLRNHTQSRKTNS